METEPTDNIKAQLGRIATFAWLGGGVILFVYDAGLRGLVTWRALVFLAVGMFVAALVVGLLTYKLFLRLADRASLSVPPAQARTAVLRAYQQSRAVAGVAGLLLVLWVYASFFWV